jgi:hypothetical protein
MESPETTTSKPKKRSSKDLKRAIREEIMHNFGSGFEAVEKASYVAIRLKGENDNCAAIGGSRGGQSIWIKQAAAEHLPDVVDMKDISLYGRGFQFKIDIADEEDPTLGLAVLAVKESLTQGE